MVVEQKILDTMSGMAKKKAVPAPADDPKWQQINLRIDDPKLLEAIDAWADKHRRSRNMAMILLLERQLANEGVWPPADQAKE